MCHQVLVHFFPPPSFPPVVRPSLPCSSFCPPCKPWWRWWHGVLGIRGPGRALHNTNFSNQGGEIAEEGTFQELLDEQGPFRALIDASRGASSSPKPPPVNQDGTRKRSGLWGPEGRVGSWVATKAVRRMSSSSEFGSDFASRTVSMALPDLSQYSFGRNSSSFQASTEDDLGGGSRTRRPSAAMDVVVRTMVSGDRGFYMATGVSARRARKDSATSDKSDMSLSNSGLFEYVGKGHASTPLHVDKRGGIRFMALVPSPNESPWQSDDDASQVGCMSFRMAPYPRDITSPHVRCVAVRSNCTIFRSVSGSEEF